MIVHSCPVCGSASIANKLAVKDYTVSGELFEVWECSICTLRFTGNPPDAAGIGKYYRSESYISHTNSAKGLINSLYLFVRKYTLRSKRRFIERMTGLKDGALLDIGAGTGAFVREMRITGWSATGLEPDDEAIKNAAQIHGIELRPSADLFQLPEGSFDAITMWHVLEHVHQLHEYLDRIKILCRKNGRIFIAVPNYTSLDAAVYGAYWAAYDVPRHLYHFSPAAMNALATAHGCTIEVVQPMWFDSFYVSMLSEKYRSGSMLTAAWNGLRSNLHALAKRNEASSLIYVLRVSE